MDTYSFTATIDGIIVYESDGMTDFAGMNGAWDAINRDLSKRGSECYPLGIEISRDGVVVERSEVEYDFDAEKWDLKK